MSNRNMRTIDVDELQSELQRTKEQVEAWSRETVAYSSALKDQHSKRMQILRGEVTSTEAELRKLQSTSQHVQERLHREQGELLAVEDLSQSLRAERDSMQRKVQAISETVHIEKVEFQKREAVFSQQEAATRRTLSALDQVLTMYERNLGLRFNNTGSNLQLALTHIDPSSPQREFTFSVMLQPDETYTVTSCEPVVPRLAELQAALNSSGDFSRFVKAMRSEFRSLVVQL